MRTFILVLLAVSMFFACGSEESNPLMEIKGEPAELSIVTGVNFYDVNGSPIGKIGNPNTLTNENLAVYPIPGDGKVTFQNLNGNGLDFWVLPVEKNKDFETVDYNTINFDYPTSILDSLHVMRGNTDLTSLKVSLDFFDAGYYRLFVEDREGNKTIENIYHDPELTANEIIVFLNSEF